MDDRALLQRFVEKSDDAAFAELVGRHIDMVYSAALRQVYDPAGAEDVTQIVFVLLAKKARTIREGEALAGWLLATTRFAALDSRRGERRRQHRERESAAMKHEAQTAEQPVWESIRPMLDEAVAGLKRDDRDAITLRYFKGHDLREVAAALGVSEQTAQKRISRAVERLRSALAHKGIVSPTTGLTSVISGNVLAQAPGHLSAQVAHAALSAPALTAAGSSLGITKGTAILMTINTKIAVAVVVLAMIGVAIPIGYHFKATPKPAPVAAVQSANTVSTTPDPKAGFNADVFEKAYGLQGDVAVRRIAPPFPDVRMEYYRTKESRQAEAIPQGPDGMIIGWRLGHSITWSMHFGAGHRGYDVQALLSYILDLTPEEVEGIGLLGKRPLGGDYVLDLDAPEEKRRAALESILSEAAGKPVTLSFRNVSRNVTVLSGKWQRKNPDGTPLDSPTAGTIQIYSQEYRTTSISGSAPVRDLAKAIGLWIKKPVLIEAEGAPAIDPVTWHNNDIIDKGPDVRAKSHDPDLVLKHITEQTGLTPSQETRTVRRLIIEQGPEPVPAK